MRNHTNFANERFVSSEVPGQGVLFELEAETPAEVKPVEEISYTSNKPEKEKKHPLRAELAPHLLRKTETIEPKNNPDGANKIGDAVTGIMEYTPGRLYVRRIVRPKYIVESTDESTKIVIAGLPSLPVPKGNAGPSMIAHILVRLKKWLYLITAKAGEETGRKVS